MLRFKPCVRFVSDGESNSSTQDEFLIRDLLQERGIACFIEDWKSWDFEREGLVIFKSCWDYHLKFQEFTHFLHKLKDKSTKTVNTLNAILWNSNKSYLYELFQNGISIPQTFIIKNEEDLNRAKVKLSKASYIVRKPLVSASAHDTHLVPVGDIENISLCKEDFILQEYIKEIVSGEISFIYISGKYSHAVKKKPKSGDFRVQKKYGATFSLYAPSKEMISFSENVCKVAQSLSGDKSGYMRIDIVETATGFVLMEVEMIEPNLFLNMSLDAQHMYVDMIESQLHSQT